MGALDFVAGAHYTHDVPPGQTDFGLRHLSLAHNRAEILPLLVQARARNPRLKIMATPWSPPAWMKTNDTLLGGRFKPGRRVYHAYARYFVRFIQEYRRAGVTNRPPAPPIRRGALFQRAACAQRRPRQSSPPPDDGPYGSARGATVLTARARGETVHARLLLFV